MKINSLFFSTLFGIGYFEKFPGTLASFLSLFIIWMLKTNLNIHIVLIFYIICLIFSFFVVSQSLKIIKTKDPKQIVIDEYIGQYTTLIFLPNELKFYVVGFILFRIFDIFKPFPINIIDRRDDTLGVIFDDILSGCFAGIIIYIFTII